MIQGLNHFNVLTDDLDRTLAFYVDGLGLRSGPRPDFNFPGAWLYAGERAILHVVAGRPLPPARTGVIDHMAFSATGLTAVKGRLDALGVTYEVRRVPGDGTWQIFCLDPSGAKVELNFDATEAAEH